MRGDAAAVYVRISKDAQGDMLGVRRQEKECRELADRLGLEVSHVLVDDDRSAYSGRPRPGYIELCGLIEARAIHTVIAWHPDRLHRSPKELESFIDLIEEGGTKVHTATAGEYDLSTASGRMTARVVGAVARHESEHKSERLRAKHRELAREGRPHGGSGRAFGYESDRTTINEAEATEIRAAVDAIINGSSVRAIAKDWESRRITTIRGKTWTPSMIKSLLVSARIAGCRQMGGESGDWVPMRVRTDGIEVHVPGIVTREQVETVRRILRDPERRRNHTSRRYLLTGGLARCGLCDAALIARPNGRKRRCYVCATGPGLDGCGKIRILAGDLETFVEAAAQEAFPADTQPLVEAAATGDEDHTSEIELVHQRIDELAKLFAGGQVETATWVAATKQLEARRAQLEVSLDKAVADLAARRAAQTAVADWDAATFDQKRSYLFAVIEAVKIMPAVRGRNFFDPARVQIVWKA